MIRKRDPRRRIARRAVLAALAIVWAASGEAQVPYRVRELGSQPARSGIGWVEPFALGGKVIFHAHEPALYESADSLWDTDGTVLGTGPLANFCPSACTTDPRALGLVNGVLLAATSDGTERTPRLWRSDGTRQGTYLLSGPGSQPVTPLLVTDPYFVINAGSLSGVAGGLVYFNTADANGSAFQVWRSDGTEAGTRPVAALAPAGGRSFATEMTSLGGKLYFVAHTIESHPPTQALWATDGTERETVKLHDFGVSGVSWLTAAGNQLLFAVRQLNAPDEIWVSDGTAAGTRAVMSFSTSRALDDTAGFKPTGDHALFVANDGQHGLQLWVSDGTAAGTRRLTGFTGGDPFGTDLRQLDLTLDPAQVEEVNGQAVFVASDGGGAFELWAAPVSPGGAGPGQVALCAAACVAPDEHLLKVGGHVLFPTNDGHGHRGLLGSTDGTPTGTSSALLRCGTDCALTSGLEPLLGSAFFTVSTAPLGASELWRSDGTAAGTVKFAAKSPGLLPAPRPFPRRLALAALGREVVIATGSLWISDGTEAGTRQLAGDAIDAGSNPGSFVVQGDRLLFTAQTTSNPYYAALWETDGSPGSATLLDDQRSFTALGTTDRRTYFAVPGSFAGQLWKSDADNPVPTEVAELPDSRNASALASAAIFGGQLYFAFGDGSLVNTWDRQLFKSDGTAAGTGPALDLPAGYALPRDLTPLGSQLYFISQGPEGGTEALATDGTPQGTVVLSHFGPSGSSTCSPPEFTRVGPTVFFVGWDRASGPQLWKTDGTPGSATLVAELAPGGDHATPVELTEHQGALYFFAYTGFGRKGLWRSDGTPAGTIQLADFPYSGYLGCPPTRSLTSTGSLLFFAADDDLRGRELWKSDGTAAGTMMVKDIFPGPLGSFPSALRAAAGQLFFNADDGVHGFELWRSDGTDAGTRMVADLAPGPDPSHPQDLTVVGNRLLFSADDGESGRELWALPLAGSGCQPSATVLCLQGNRFAVTIDWQDFTGHTGAGQAVALTADTGYFWFFGAANVEVIVKVLDGRPLNGNFWVFYGALSSVRYAVTVTDTATGLARRYDNFAGNLASVADTQAFGATGVNGGGGAVLAAAPAPAGRIAGRRAQGWPPGAARAAQDLSPATLPGLRDAPEAAGGCAADAAHLCLNGSRFAVEASWTDFTGRKGSGVAVGLTDDTGYFWFFAPSNVEVVLKVLDGRALNGHFWVFYGALSSVDYTLKVTDTVTGAVRTYHNPSGQLASAADTSAF
jgi:ELWxxDGT repeat protein